MKADRVIRAYRSASRWRRRFLTVTNGCFDGFWLGMADRATLARLDEGFYSNGADVLEGRTFTYADEQYNLGGLQAWEAAAIDAHFPPGTRVLVTGAGGGREVIALLERGFDAVGYEPNADLAAAGAALLRKHGHGERLSACERDAFPAAASSCDALVVGWGSYMLIPGRARRVAFLRAGRQVMPEGAPLLCSFFVRRPGNRYHAIVTRTANVVRRIRRAERAELGDMIGDNYVHSFTRGEIASELSAGGFRLIAFEREPYGHAVAVAAPHPTAEGDATSP